MQSAKKYDHNKIEKKWQKYWREHKTFQCKIDKSKPKYYILDMFPYPSGAGLHVGHVAGYTGTDIIARHMRQKGYNVLHPMGWDSFGLPAEQYALRTGTHPSITTKKNIATYREQLESLGFSYDWSREFATSDTNYYKWTQWIFTKIYEKGLAYEAQMNVNYCPSLGTVLANEEIENGRSVMGGYPVVKKPVRQWVLKITEYADRLIQDLDLVDWPEHLKKLQINWIGKSQGAQVYFQECQTKQNITVFTTRADTLFGVSYLVIAPEHQLIKTFTTPDQKKQVEEYLTKTALKSDLERTDLAKVQTGIWTGSYALHPITKEKLPIWIADYVLISYGTGAVMAVPAHDTRDFAFAQKYSLPISVVIQPANEGDEFSDEEMKNISEEVVNKKRCWDGFGKMINSSYKEFSLDGLVGTEAIEKMIQYLEEKKLGKRSISYKLRDWLFSRQRYWGEPIPIVHFADGTKRALELDELPLLPPEISDYSPAEEGESPLAKEKQWVEIVDKKTKKAAKRETNTMPQWAGSCWYYLRFCDPHNQDAPWSEEAEKYWMNVDLYVGGAEHAVLHLLYARFWHKILYDSSLVSSLEPFQKYRNQGVVTALVYPKEGGGYVHPDDVVEKEKKFYSAQTNEEILPPQVEKMSKSKLNGVSPDEILEEFGADALRLYEMFMGPFDKEKLWNTDAVSGCKRFLNRFFDLAHSSKVSEEVTQEALRLGHRLLSLVINDIELMGFNTAIAHMMEFVNAFIKLHIYPKQVLKMATQVLYPFAPHIAEEIWHHLGEETTIAFEPIPQVEEKYLQDEICTFVIQINGKVRSRVEMSVDATKEELLQYAHTQEQIVQNYLSQGTIVKTIFVPKKLLNIVMQK